MTTQQVETTYTFFANISVKFSRITLVILLLATISFAACTSTGGDTDLYERIEDNPHTFTVDDFESTGFKLVKDYNVDGLIGANKAVHGFQKYSSGPPLSYEIRFYESHDEAVQLGRSLAEEVTGKDAIMVTGDMTWKAGNKQQREQLLEGGGYQAFYWDYMISGNIVILCEGDWVEQSQEACTKLIDSVSEMISS